jgi:Arc/MetJ-type ribon-helix-helix transcriptional regulator
MELELPPGQGAFMRKAVVSGRYASVKDAVSHAEAGRVVLHEKVERRLKSCGKTQRDH